MQEMVHWPLREVILRYIHILREKTAEAYRTDCLIWAAKTAFGGGKPPKVPALLRADG